MEPRLDLSVEAVLLAIADGIGVCANGSCMAKFSRFFIVWRPQHCGCKELKHRDRCIHESAVCTKCVQKHEALYEDHLSEGYVILSQGK